MCPPSNSQATTARIWKQHSKVIRSPRRGSWVDTNEPAEQGMKIHRDDWVAIVKWALHTDVSGALNLAAPTPVTNREFAQTLGRVLRRPAVMPAPPLALRLALGEMADVLLFSQRVIPAKAEQLGFRFRYPTLEPALAAALRNRPPSGGATSM